MALPTTVVPPAPAMLGAGEDRAKQEYFAALQKTLSALEARANQGTNWWQVAGALLNPGKTGSLGESLGNVANVMGEQQQRQLDQQIPIAQARAQIAGQKYEIESQSKAIQLLSQAIGVPPQVVAQQLSDGSLSPQAVANIPPAVYAQIATLSPKVGEVVKNIADMSNKNANLNLDQRKFDETKIQNKIGNAREDLKSGISIAELVAKYGQDIVGLIYTNKPASSAGAMPPPAIGAMPPPVAPPAIGAMPPPVAPPVEPPPAALPVASNNPGTFGDPSGMPSAVPSALGMPGPSPKPMPITPPPAAAPPAAVPAAPPKLSMTPPAKLPLDQQPTIAPSKSALYGKNSQLGAPPDVAGVVNAIDDLSGLPLATQAEVKKKRLEEGDKVWQTKRDEIFSYTPQTLQGSNTNLRQLDYYATKFPNIFALMQQQGTIAALQQAAQDGITLQAGQFNARVGLNVRDFLQKVKLNPNEQQAARDVGRILGSEFLNNLKTQRGLLGVNPTDNDARLLQAPMANIDDSSKAMQLWARNQLLLNKQREALYGGLQKYSQQIGPTSSPGSFFRPGSIYEKINNDYANYRMQLFNQFNPK